MLGAAVPDRAAAVAERHVPSARGDEQLCDGGRRRARAVEDDTDVREPLADKLERIGESRQRDDGGAVLIVVEDGDIAACLEPALDFKAAGRGDILQIHTAEAACQQAHSVDDLVHVFTAHAQRNRVHAAEGLEQNALALHDGHARLGADVAETENGSTVGDDGDGIPAARELVALVHVLLDLQTGRGDAGGVGKTQRITGIDRRAGDDLQLAFPFIVLCKRCFRVIHGGSPFYHIIFSG